MLSEKAKELLKPAALTPTAIWGATTSTIVVLLFVLYFMDPKADGGSPEELDMIRYSLMGVAAVAAIASLFFFRHSHSEAFLRKALEKEANPEKLARNPQTDEVNQKKLEALQELPPHELKLMLIPGAVFAPMIISWVLGEAVAILGFVLGFLSEEPTEMLPFAAVAIVLQLLHFPKMKSLFERGAQISRNTVSSGI